MKRIITLAALTLAMLPVCVPAYAQSASGDTGKMKGVVTDKKNRPIVGAKVEIPGEPGFVLTNPDGSFEFPSTLGKQKIRVSYSGYKSSKKKAKDGMQIKLGGQKGWRMAPEKYTWFVNAEAFFPFDVFRRPAFGLMGGIVKTFGLYAKVGTNAFSDKSADTWRWDVPYSYEYTRYDYDWNRGNSVTLENQSQLLTGNKHMRFTTLGGGLIFRLGCPLHLYLGASYVDLNTQLEQVDGSWIEIKDLTRHTLSIDYGFMFRIKHVMLNAGVQAVNMPGTVETFATGNFGIGYVF